MESAVHGRYDMRKQSVVYSFCIHLALITLLLLMATYSHYSSNTWHAVTTLEIPRKQHLTAPRLRQVAANPGSEGGGQRNPLPVERGEVPHVAQKIFIPPTPRSQVTPRITLPTGLDDMPQIATDAPVGIPAGFLGTRSAGPGDGGGLGPGNGKKVGPGDGHGPGTTPGIGAGGTRIRLSALPQVLWKIEPEYSEEARKVRHQGTVMLALEVDSEGRPRNIRVIRSLGMGLDERAMDAVARWRFKPGVYNGRPVSAPVSVEVSFRLL